MNIQASSINWTIKPLLLGFLLLSGTAIMAQQDALKIEPNGVVNIPIFKSDEGVITRLVNTTGNIKNLTSSRATLDILSNDTMYTKKIYIGEGYSNDYALYISNFKNLEVSDCKFYQKQGPSSYNGTSVSWTSVYTYGGIVSRSFAAFSDQRIKRDFKTSQNAKDLHLLNQLEVTDYRYKDVIQLGNASAKGFVAQQVERIYPQAVSKQTDFIPDIYAMSKKIAHQENQFLITLEKAHELKNQDEVKLIANTGEKVLKVEVIDDFTFAVNDWEETLDKVFVFGKKVEDLRAVNYDAIFTLGVSAIQELSKQVDVLKAENERLRQESRQKDLVMAQQIAQLQASMDKLLEKETKSTGLTSNSADLIKHRSNN